MASNETARIMGNSIGNVERFPSTTEDIKTPTTISYLLEQIGVLKTKNQELLIEHKEAIRRYEDKLAQKEQRLSDLFKGVRGEIVNSLEQPHLSRNHGTDVEVWSLRRKLQELESEHMEEKKRYTFELEQMKQELGQSRKSLSDQKASSAILQKQLDAAERKVKDMKKAMATDQMEIKTLKSQLQSADQTRVKAHSQSQETDQLKKIIRQLETKQRAENQALTAKLEENAKKHASKIKERDVSHVKLQGQIQVAEQQLKTLQRELESKTGNNQELVVDLERAEEELGNLRYWIPRITEAYSELVKKSVPLVKYNQLEHAYLTTRFRLFRSERRLADRETVIEQLADLCKELSEEKLTLKRLIEDWETEQKTTLSLSPTSDDMHNMASMIDMANIRAENLQEENHLQRVEMDVLIHLRDLYREHSKNLLSAYITSDIETSKLSTLQDHFIAQITRVTQDMAEMNIERDRISEELSLTSKRLMENEARYTSLSAQLTKQQGELTTLETTSKKYLQNAQHLTQALYHSETNEGHLEREITRLSDELATALQYKEAHADLLSEVISLIQRNELAEAEAERLSRFNAEILSHKNPQQKICYMDRIRSELSETKYELVRSTREREVLVATTASLQNELAAYKSISVPIEHKPVGSRVRVERIRLDSLDINQPLPS